MVLLETLAGAGGLRGKFGVRRVLRICLLLSHGDLPGPKELCKLTAQNHTRTASKAIGLDTLRVGVFLFSDLLFFTSLVVQVSHLLLQCACSPLPRFVIASVAVMLNQSDTRTNKPFSGGIRNPLTV